ncbi:hypothetical protein V6N13_124241 [Hibiscus sabdariffa]
MQAVDDKGGRFSWSNFRETASFSRLDRFLLSPEVLREWPDLIQTIHPKAYVERGNDECNIARGMGIGTVLRRCKLVSKEWVLRRGEKSSDIIRDLENKCSEIEDKIADGSQEPSLRERKCVDRRGGDKRILRAASLWGGSQLVLLLLVVFNNVLVSFRRGSTDAFIARDHSIRYVRLSACVHHCGSVGSFERALLLPLGVEMRA